MSEQATPQEIPRGILSLAADPEYQAKRRAELAIERYVAERFAFFIVPEVFSLH